MHSSANPFGPVPRSPPFGPRIPFSRSTSLSTAAEPEIIAEPPYGGERSADQPADVEVLSKLTGQSAEEISGISQKRTLLAPGAARAAPE